MRMEILLLIIVHIDEEITQILLETKRLLMIDTRILHQQILLKLVKMLSHTIKNRQKMITKAAKLYNMYIKKKS